MKMIEKKKSEWITGNWRACARTRNKHDGFDARKKRSANNYEPGFINDERDMNNKGEKCDIARRKKQREKRRKKKVGFPTLNVGRRRRCGRFKDRR